MTKTTVAEMAFKLGLLNSNPIVKKAIEKEKEQMLNLHERRDAEKNKVHICYKCGADIIGWNSDCMTNHYLKCYCKKCDTWNTYSYWR